MPLQCLYGVLAHPWNGWSEKIPERSPAAPPGQGTALDPGGNSPFMNRFASLVLPCAAAVVLGGATACADRTPPDPGAFAGVALDGSVTMPDVTLPDVHGDPFHLPTETEGRVTLLFVGYTYCPDICPVHLANLGTVLRDLPVEDAEEVRTVFVTADPHRDTPERLREWLGAMHRDFVGLRGTREEVNALEKSLGLAASVTSPPGTPDEEYIVAHAGQVLAFDREGRARAAYPWGIRQKDWSLDLPRLIRGDWPAWETS